MLKLWPAEMGLACCTLHGGTSRVTGLEDLEGVETYRGGIVFADDGLIMGYGILTLYWILIFRGG